MDIHSRGNKMLNALKQRQNNENKFLKLSLDNKNNQIFESKGINITSHQVLNPMPINNKNATDLAPKYVELTDLNLNVNDLEVNNCVEINLHHTEVIDHEGKEQVSNISEIKKFVENTINIKDNKISDSIVSYIRPIEGSDSEEDEPDNFNTDPDFIVDEHYEDISGEEEQPAYKNNEPDISFDDNDENASLNNCSSKKRKHKALAGEWRKNRAKTNRMCGLAYEGYNRPKSKIITQGVIRPPRKQIVTCKSQYCIKSKRRNCSQFTDDDRKVIFKSFWEMNWEQKKSYVTGLITQSNVSNSRTVDVSVRQYSYEYHLKLQNGASLQVCRGMFLGTLGIKEKMVRMWRKNELIYGFHENPTSSAEKRVATFKTTARYEINQTLKTHLREFLENFPKLESHYCRKDSSKLYFQTTHRSKSELYNDYKEKCLNEQITPLSDCFFYNTLKELNFALFKPRKDQCDTCTQYNVGNMEKVDYTEHRAQINKCHTEKTTDENNAAISTEVKLLCMDVQAVKLCPQLNASSVYYKMKLQIHNFTIYDMVTHQSSNYVWDETEGELVASVFTSIIIKHLERLLNNNPISTIIIWSDGCGYQNRNHILSNALLNFAVKYKITVFQKYLEKGHTQNHCDSTHSLIERKIKGREFNLPSEFVSLAKQARKKPFELEVFHLNHSYFSIYDDVDLMRLSSIRPGKISKDPTVNHLRCLKYCPDATIYYKLDFEEELKLLPQRFKILTIPLKEPAILYKKRLTITEKKWKHLQQLKAFIPADTHTYYDCISFHPDKIKDQDKNVNQNEHSNETMQNPKSRKKN